MAMLERQAKSLGKTLIGQTTAKKAIVPNIVTGVGIDQTLRAADNTFGAPLQRIFSVQLPIVGNVGPIDVINYMIHTGGKLTKNVVAGLTAVGGAKAISGGLGSLNLPIPGVQSVANPNVVPSGPGAPL